MKAYANMPLMEGARLQTMEDGAAEVELEDGSIFRIVPNSTLQINTLRWDGNNLPQTEVELLSGLGYFEIKPDQEGASSRIRVATEVIETQEPSVLRITHENGPALVEMLSGTATVTNGSDLYQVDVRAGESLVTDQDDDSRYFLSNGIQPDSWDNWNADRDSELAARAAQQTQASASLPIANNPALADLDDAGEWYEVPGTGYVWSPKDVGDDWDPYGYGYWISYPIYGYTWVSGYRWGYLPYHCGAWSYFEGFGWGWVPAGCNSRGFSFEPGQILVSNPRPRWTPPAVPLQSGKGSGKPGKVVLVGSPNHPAEPVHREPGEPVVIAGEPAKALLPLHPHNKQTSESDIAPSLVGGAIVAAPHTEYRYGNASTATRSGITASPRRPAPSQSTTAQPLTPSEIMPRTSAPRYSLPPKAPARTAPPSTHTANPNGK